MKRTIALILVLVLGLALLTGCKKNQAAAPNGTSASVNTQTAGNLTVLVPQGWNLVSDAQQPNHAYICKGGSDLNKNAYIKLTCGGVLPPQGICSNVQALESRTYGSLTWSGFSGIKPTGSVIYLVNQTESGSLLATLWYTAESGAISLEDQDVQAILGNVSFSNASAN